MSAKGIIVLVFSAAALVSIGIWVFVFRVVPVPPPPPPPPDPGRFVENSSDAILGSIGIKQQMKTGQEFFERQTIPAWRNLEVYNAGITLRTQKDLNDLGLRAAARAELETKANRNSSSTYKLIRLQIRDHQNVARELRALIATDSDMRSLLRQPGVRIVREVEEIFDHQKTDALEAKTGSSATLAKVRGTDIQLSFDMKTDRRLTFTLSDETVVAYRLAMICWSADAKVLQLRLDQGQGCPTGLSETVPDVPAATTCPNIEGTWTRRLDGAHQTFHQEGCTIAADSPTGGGFGHSVRGVYENDHFQYVTTRKNLTTGCSTELYGNITLLAPNEMRIVVTATDGKCDLLPGFYEDLIWDRGTQPAAVSEKIHSGNSSGGTSTH